MATPSSISAGRQGVETAKQRPKKGLLRSTNSGRILQHGKQTFAGLPDIDCLLEPQYRHPLQISEQSLRADLRRAAQGRAGTCGPGSCMAAILPCLPSSSSRLTGRSAISSGYRNPASSVRLPKPWQEHCGSSFHAWLRLLVVPKPR